MKHVYLVRHSTTSDGRNNVRGSRMAVALATLAGAFFPEREFAAAFSSPQQRAHETGEFFLEAAGADPKMIQLDDTFDALPKETKTPERMVLLEEICATTGITTEEAIFLPTVGMQDFLKQQGEAGLSRIQEITRELEDESSVVIFTHGGSVIEPICIAAARVLHPKEGPFSLTEIQGAVVETGAYRIDFESRVPSDNPSFTNYPVLVEQVRMPNSIKRLVQRAKKERR